MVWKTRLFKMGALVGVCLIVSVISVAAEPLCHITINTQVSSGVWPSSIPQGQSVFDTATIKPDSTGLLQGTMKFYVCGPTTSVTPCSSEGTLVSTTTLNRNVTANVAFTVQSGNYTPTATGVYCFRAVFTQTGGIFPSLTHVGGNSGTLSECVTVTPLFSIGNLVFKDTNQNGIRDNGETGLPNVAMQLLKYPSASCVGDPTFTSTTTDANGYYRFDFTQTGYYKAQVAAANFNSGGALFGYLNSSPTFSSYNPTTNSNDSRDHGVFPAVGGAIQSECVTINQGSAPIGETNFGPGDSAAAPDANSDLTQDFGFWSSPTAVTLSSFNAQPDAGNNLWASWAGAVGLIVAGFGAFLFARR